MEMKAAQVKDWESERERFIEDIFGEQNKIYVANTTKLKAFFWCCWSSMRSHSEWKARKDSEIILSRLRAEICFHFRPTGRHVSSIQCNRVVKPSCYTIKLAFNYHFISCFYPFSIPLWLDAVFPKKHCRPVTWRLALQLQLHEKSKLTWNGAFRAVHSLLVTHEIQFFFAGPSTRISLLPVSLSFFFIFLLLLWLQLADYFSPFVLNHSGRRRREGIDTRTNVTSRLFNQLFKGGLPLIVITGQSKQICATLGPLMKYCSSYQLGQMLCLFTFRRTAALNWVSCN